MCVCVHTFFSNGCANVQIRSLIFDVLRQRKNVLQLRVALFQVTLCHLPTKRKHIEQHVWHTSVTSATEACSSPPTCRRPMVVLISSTSPTVTILDLSICVMRRSQLASSVAVSLRSVGATESGECGVWWCGSSLTRLAICTADGTADTEVKSSQVDDGKNKETLLDKDLKNVANCD